MRVRGRKRTGEEARGRKRTEEEDPSPTLPCEGRERGEGAIGAGKELKEL